MKYFEFFIGLLITIIIEAITIFYINKKKTTNSKLKTTFNYLLYSMMFWCVGLIAQILIINYVPTISPIYPEYFIYIFVVFMPVILFFIAYNLSEDKKYKKSQLLLFIIPVTTMLVLWTNEFHHLFYKVYSVNPETTVFGPYFYVHSVYTYGLFIIDIIILLKNSMKDSKGVSKQFILMAIGALVPLIVNILGMTVFDMNIYITPISFMTTFLCFAIAIFRYDFLDVAPIALKTIVDQISDAYVVLSKDEIITNCNKTFEKIFKIDRKKLIGKQFEEIEISKSITVKKKKLGEYFKTIKHDEKLHIAEAILKKQNKYFNIEITGIYKERKYVGTLILFKDTTQHILDMEALKQNQDILMERERLASLGQMIGGIAHNLKTPIMSISGAMEGLTDLITEYQESINDPDVTKEDHQAIAKDMLEWVNKVNSYDSYMSDIITAVKGQAVNMTEDATMIFEVEELLNRVNILMKHELKNAFIKLNVVKKVEDHTKIIGNINSLVQVVNNLISNAIQSYGGKPDQVIDLVIDKEKNNIIISVIDHGSGIPEEIQKKLFNEMITTKGHNGTGLGLFMSYSTIKGHFNGDINFKSKVGVGTTFNIVLPQ